MNRMCMYVCVYILSRLCYNIDTMVAAVMVELRIADGFLYGADTSGHRLSGRDRKAGVK